VPEAQVTVGTRKKNKAENHDSAIRS